MVMIFQQFITRRFLFTVKHTEKYLCALTVTHLHVNWLQRLSINVNGAYKRHLRVSRMLLVMRYCLEKLGE